MNILPKKSWHVRNKDNVAKVRKDEENAKQEEKERLRRVALAEQESRTELLRQRARTSLKNDTDSDITGSTVEKYVPKPVNFFQDIGPDGRAISLGTKNVEHEEEKRKEKEQAEKKIGLLTFLGQSAVETLPDDEKPWYFKPPTKKPVSEESNKLSKSESIDVKRKSSLDPLIDMNKHLAKKKKKHKHKSKKEKEIKQKKVNKVLSPDDKLAQLRKARVERESREKQRALSLMQKHYGINPSATSTPVESFSQKYNNQFNPRLARNNKTK